MKRTIFGVGVSISILIMLVSGLSIEGIIPEARAVDTGAHAPQLEGTWLVAVTPPPGGPGVYTSMASFAAGGVLITAPDPSAGLLGKSSGQGTWEKSESDRFASSHVAFIYNETGGITGTIRINSSYQLTGKDTFVGYGQLQFCDITLTNCFTVPGCATLSGNRINVEPPSCP
jgi:hypothetical protein